MQRLFQEAGALRYEAPLPVERFVDESFSQAAGARPATS
jgi:hypothetical protein